MNRKKGATGKNNADVTSQDFYRHYYDTEKKPIPYSALKDLYKELMEGHNELMLNGESVLIPNLGTFSIKTYKPKMFDKDGNFIKPPVDFGRTWKYWRSIYKDMTDEEIENIENKVVLRYENKHSKGYKYTFYWDHSKHPIPGKQVYRFKPTTKYKRKLAQVLKSDSTICFELINY